MLELLSPLFGVITNNAWDLEVKAAPWISGNNK
jgi:hypothetical protein